MDLTFTLRLDETLVRDVAQRAVTEAFKQPDYSGRGGIGYNTVQRQTWECIESMDFRDTIRRMVANVLDETAREVVKSVLRDELRKQAKELKAAGGLLEVAE